MALSVDSPEENRELRAKWDLNFPILSDPDRALLKKIGMLHAGAGPGGSDVARPGIYVIARDGKVAWFGAGSTVRERPDPAEVLAVVRKLARK